MHCHCGTNNKAPRWTFTDPCKPEVRPGAREESAYPARLAAPAMNARDTTKVYIWYIQTTWRVSLLVDQWVPMGTCSKSQRSTSVDPKRFESIKIFRVKVDWICHFMGLIHIPFGFTLIWHFWGITFRFLIYFFWPRFTNEDFEPEMSISSIMLIDSDFNRCMHLSRILFSFLNY